MDDPLIGKVLCGHRFERLLARGDGEVVYLASQLSVARAVVAKVLAPEEAVTKGRVGEFLARARRAGGLKHPGIVELHEVCQQGEVIFYTMEYLPGGTLAQWVERRGPVSVRQYLKRLGVVVDALVYAEEEGIVHGRLEPGHLLIARDGRLKVLGLGLKPLDAGGDQSSPTSSGLRLCCLAPEQIRPGARRRAADTRSDVYAFGCTSYFALTGEPPFGRGTHEEILAAKRLHRLTSIRDLRPEVPQELASLIERMMALSPERRAPSFRQVREALREVSESLPAPRGVVDPSGESREVGPRDAGGKALRFTLGIAALLAIAAACVYLAIGSGPDTGVAPPPEAAHEPVAAPDARTGLDEAMARASQARAELARARGLVQDGKYRVALEELARLTFQFPEEQTLFERAKQDARVAARSELEGIGAQADGHVALGEFEEALGVLDDLVPRLPEDLLAEAQSKRARVEEARWSSALDAALRVVSSRVATLDFDGALRALDSLDAGGRKDQADRTAEARGEILEARRLWSRLESASVGAWTDLPRELQRSYPGERAFSVTEFRSTLLHAAATLLQGEIEQTMGASLFRGAFRALDGDEVELSYDFSTTDQLEDFHAIEGAQTQLEIQGGQLQLRGECRLLEGEPFRGSLGLALEISRYDEKRPNINVALWTGANDQVSYRESAREVGRVGTLPEGPEPPRFVALCAGYSLSTLLAQYLKVQGSEPDLLFPCHAILRAPRGRSLHDDLSFRCDWGLGLFPAGLKGVRNVEILVSPDRFRWVVEGTAVHESVGAALAAEIQQLATQKVGGSLTIFTNGSAIAMDSLTVRGQLDPEWVAARVRKLALRRLRALLGDLDWDAALRP